MQLLIENDTFKSNKSWYLLLTVKKTWLCTGKCVQYWEVTSCSAEESPIVAHFLPLSRSPTSWKVVLPPFYSTAYGSFLDPEVIEESVPFFHHSLMNFTSEFKSTSPLCSRRCTRRAPLTSQNDRFDRPSPFRVLVKSLMWEKCLLKIMDDVVIQFHRAATWVVCFDMYLRWWWLNN